MAKPIIINSPFKEDNEYIEIPMTKEVDELAHLYFSEKKYQEVVEKSKYIVENKFEKVEIVKKYKKKKRNEILTWVSNVYQLNILALVKLGHYQDAINSAKEKIEYCKELVQYFPGFFGSEEILIYMLYFALSDRNQVEKIRRNFLETHQLTEKQLEGIEKDATNKKFYLDNN